MSTSPLLKICTFCSLLFISCMLNSIVCRQFPASYPAVSPPHRISNPVRYLESLHQGVLIFTRQYFRTTNNIAAVEPERTYDSSQPYALRELCIDCILAHIEHPSILEKLSSLPNTLREKCIQLAAPKLLLSDIVLTHVCSVSLISFTIFLKISFR